ncbi:MAG TPA: sigma-70 family RNA polymerase sigma factor [Steroidobacteraceae bacterium]
MDDRRHRFESEVLPHLDAAYRFARWLSSAPAEVDDIVQEAMLRAFRAFETLRGSDAKSWLLAIVKNCHSTAMRRSRRREFVPLPDDGEAEEAHAVTFGAPDPESASILRDEGRTLERLLAALPEEHREVLVLRELEELDYRGIAAVTNLPIGTVMSRLARARASLRARWLREVEGAPRAVR